MQRFFLLLLAALLLAPPLLHAQAPGWSSATAGGISQANGTSVIRAVAADASGNLFVTGYFTGSVAFGSTSLSSLGNTDLFVAKYVPATATWAWAQSGGGTGNDRGLGVAVSGTSVYVTGILTNNTSNANGVLLGGTGTTPGTVQQYGATTTASPDLVLAKYTDNGSSATLGWTQVGGGTDNDTGYGVAVSGTSVYVTGYISNNTGNVYGVLFGATGTTAGTVPQYGASSVAGNDLVLAKYTDNGSSATLGWTQVGGGTDYDTGQGVAVSGTSVYVTGALTNNTSNAKVVLFGGTGTTAGTVRQYGATSISSSSTDLLLAKYTDNGSTGTFGWSQVGGGTDYDTGYGLAVSGSSVYITGYLNNSTSNQNGALFGGTGTTVGTARQYGASGIPSADLLLAKYTDNGSTGTFGWSQVGGGISYEEGQSVAVSGSSVYVAGYITNRSDNANGVLFGGTGTTPGTVTQNGVVSTYSQDLLLAKYTDNGNTATLGWTQAGGGAGPDQGQSVAVSGSSIYVAGYITPSASFGSSTIASPAGSQTGVLVRALDAQTTPTLTSLSLSSGSVGTSVTLTGTNLSGATSVSFNGTTQTAITNNTGTSLTVVVPGGATTGSVTVTTPNGTSNGLPFTVVNDLTISASTLASPTAVPAGTYGTITVTGTGVAQLTGAVVVNTAVVVNGVLLTNCQPLTGAGTFTLNAGATLGICDSNGMYSTGASGAVQVTGTRSFSTDATYVYNGTQAQSTGPGLPATVRALTVDNPVGVGLTQAVAVTQAVTLANTGNLQLNANTLLLRSDAAGTALIANLGTGVVNGSTGTMQRYIGTNINSSGYRQYASPMAAVTGAETLATLATAGYTPDFSGAAAYNSSATPGLVTPFPTVFGYNQDRIATSPSSYSTFDKGWQAALGTDVPQAGRGYSVQAPGAALIDFTGTFTSGAVSRSNLQRASADANTGWHLLGNPFPSPLDWSTMTIGAGQSLDGVDGAVYVSQSSGPYVGSYRTYLAAAPGQGNPLIPAGSGFFVHTSSAATPGTVRFTGANRVTTFAAQPAFGRTTADLRPLLTLAVQGNGVADAVSVYFDAAATAAIDPTHDAAKLPNGHGLNLATLTGATALAIDGRPAPAATTVLPLSLGVPAAGVYTLSVPTLDNFGGFTLYLRDALLGTDQLLSAGTTVPVSLPASATASLRFSLVLRPAGALATTGAVLAAQASLYPNPAHGAFTLRVPPVAGATQATATLLNALGQVVLTRTLALPASGTTADFGTAGLAPGVYALRLTAGAEAATLRVVIE